MKKILGIVFILTMFVALNLCAKAADVNDLTFDSTKGAITKCSVDASGELIVPNEIQGITVTEIGERAFFNCEKLTKIILPNSLVTIEYDAFRKSGLTSIEIPEGVKSIGSSVFYECPNLVDVTLPESLTTIGDYAFAYCDSLKNVNIPSNVTHLDFGVFGHCNSLEEITIPSTVTNLGADNFHACENLRKITFFGYNTRAGAIMDDREGKCTIYAYEGSEIQKRTLGGMFGNAKFEALNPSIKTVDTEVQADKTIVTIDSEYTQGGNMIAVGMNGDTLSDIAKVTDGTAELNGTADSIKVFCWVDLQSMIPLCEPKEVTVQ